MPFIGMKTFQRQTDLQLCWQLQPGGCFHFYTFSACKVWFFLIVKISLPEWKLNSLQLPQVCRSREVSSGVKSLSEVASFYL